MRVGSGSSIETLRRPVHADLRHDPSERRHASSRPRAK